MFANRTSRLSLALAALLALAAFIAPASSRAQTDSATSGGPQISEALSAELGNLRTFVDAKTPEGYASAITLIDRLTAAAPVDSFDVSLLAQFKVQILIDQGKFIQAIAPLETAVRLGETRSYIAAGTQLDYLYLLAQLYQQQATETKDPAAQRAAFEKSAVSVRRWQARSPKSSTEVQVFAASLYYQQATLDPDRPDLKKLAEARAEAEKGLSIQLRPPASFYILILAALQQSGDYRQSAEILELLVAQTPTNAGNWNQLASTYVSLAGSAKTAREAREFNIRAILTIERAQARGFLTTPKENFNLVALYLTLQQFDPAIALLEKGLKDGSIEGIRRNWELLASTYQQIGREKDAIATYEKATAAFPDEGQLEFVLAQLLYASNHPADARLHLEKATEKGRLEKPGQARLFIAYIAFEAKDYTDATKWAKEAAIFDDVKKEDLNRLKQAIDEAVAALPDPVSKS